jgi:PAS domain S-box-containing protein
MMVKSAERLRILYVDDSQFDRALVRDALEEEATGFHLTEVASRGELEHLLESGGPFDLVLSDFNILGMTGLEVLEQVSACLPGTPVILVTGTGSEEIAVQALKAGADDYVIKQPSHIRRLPETIRATLETRRARLDRDQARKELEASEFRFRLLAENSTDLLLRLSSEGTILYASPASVSLLGRDPRALVGSRIASLIHSQDRDEVEEILAAVRAPTWEGAMPLVFPLFRLEGLQGEVRWVETRGRLIPAESSVSGSDEIQLALRDVTDRREMELRLRESQEKLRQVERLESIGRLAGGIAHDFNNLLTVIAGNASLLEEGIDLGDPLRQELAEITQATRRAGELTHHLLEFSSRGMTRLREVDPTALLEETRGMLRSTLPPEIRLEVRLEEPLPAVLADPARLQQVIINLAINGRDAIGSEGTIRIQADVWIPPSPQASLSESAAFGRSWEGHVGDARVHGTPTTSPVLRIRVSDDGHGMSREVMDRAFEPFFTTKEPGKGTGLGLASAFGTVRQAGGTILVDSVPGEGSTFTVLLPVPGSVSREGVVETGATTNPP